MEQGQLKAVKAKNGSLLVNRTLQNDQCVHCDYMHDVWRTETIPTSRIVLFILVLDWMMAKVNGRTNGSDKRILTSQTISHQSRYGVKQRQVNTTASGNFEILLTHHSRSRQFLLFGNKPLEPKTQDLQNKLLIGAYGCEM